MALVPIISDEEAGPEVRTLLYHSKQMFGRTANAVRVAAHTPKLAQSIFGFIDVRTKCLVILKTSMLNGCAY